MTTHELAKLLLEQQDIPATVHLGNGWLIEVHNVRTKMNPYFPTDKYGIRGLSVAGPSIMIVG